MMNYEHDNIKPEYSILPKVVENTFEIKTNKLH
jgi:hypothetical protein